MNQEPLPAQGPIDVNFSGVITHGGTDRGYKLCRCHKCGVESVCTPSNDFYTTESVDEPLKCEACLREYIMLRNASITKGGPRGARREEIHE